MFIMANPRAQPPLGFQWVIPIILAIAALSITLHIAWDGVCAIPNNAAQLPCGGKTSAQAVSKDSVCNVLHSCVVPPVIARLALPTTLMAAATVAFPLHLADRLSPLTQPPRA